MEQSTTPVTGRRGPDSREAVRHGGVHGAVPRCSTIAALSRYGRTSRTGRRHDAPRLPVTPRRSHRPRPVAVLIGAEGVPPGVIVAAADAIIK